MAQEYCTACGTLILEGERYCSHCGEMRSSLRELCQLVEGAKRGSQEAFAALYERTKQKYYAAAISIFRDKRSSAEAEDALQDAYIKIFQHINELVHPENFIAWGNKIVVNTSLNLLRRKAPALVEEERELDLVVLEEEQGSEEANPEAVYDRKETAQMIQEILDELPEAQRTSIYLFYIQEYSVGEIAELLGVTENTVKSRLNYGRRKIKGKVEDLEKRGIKLYSMAPFVFFLWAYRHAAQDVEAAACPPKNLFGKILDGLGSGQPGTAPKLEARQAGSHGERAASRTLRYGKSRTAAKMAGTGAKGILAQTSVKVAIGMITVGLLGGSAALWHMNATRPVSSLRMETETSGTEETLSASEQDTAEVSEPTTGNAVETGGETETQSESETQSEIVTQPETEPETVTPSVVVVETESETESETQQASDTAQDVISRMSYEYIGNTSYAVTYLGGSIETYNVGLQNREPPLGAISYQEDDWDGDGDQELLLILSVASERRHSSGDYGSASIGVCVCEQRDGQWVPGEIVSGFYSFAEYLPYVEAYAVPASQGKEVILRLELVGAFAGDTFSDMAVFSYQNETLSVGRYEAGSDEAQLAGYREAAGRVESDEAEKLCRVYAEGIYSDSGEMDTAAVTTLYQGGSLDLTLQYEDFVDHASEKPTASQETESTAETVAASDWREFYEQYMAQYGLTDLSQLQEASMEFPFTANYLVAATQIDLDGDGMEELVLLRTQAPGGGTADTGDSSQTYMEIYRMKNGVEQQAGEITLDGYGLDNYSTMHEMSVHQYTFQDTVYFLTYDFIHGSASAGYYYFTIYSWKEDVLNRETTIWFSSNTGVSQDGNDLEGSSVDKYSVLQNMVSPYGLTAVDMMAYTDNGNDSEYTVGGWIQLPENEICILQEDSLNQNLLQESTTGYSVTMNINGKNDFAG